MSEVAKKSTDPQPAERAPVPTSMVRKAVVASAMGNAMEWFDYGVFTSGTITGVIGRVYFPGDSNALAVPTARAPAAQVTVA